MTGGCSNEKLSYMFYNLDYYYVFYIKVKQMENEETKDVHWENHKDNITHLKNWLITAKANKLHYKKQLLECDEIIDKLETQISNLIN